MSRGRHARKTDVATRVRHALPALAVLSGLSAAALALAPTPVADAASNPLRPASVSSHGFGVLVEHDATLLSNESETGVAIGGTLTFGRYQVVDKDTVSYTATGDSAPTALVAGAVDWSASTGVLNVTESRGAKLGGTYDVNTQNANAPRLVASGAGFNSATRIDVTAPATSVGPTGPSGFDLPQLFASYRDSSDSLATLSDTGVLRNDAGTSAWVSGNARLVLAPGQNVLTVTPAQLAALGSVNPGNGASLGANAWLIINVVGSGDITLSGPTAAIGYSGGANSQSHVLWNLTTSGTVTVAGNDQLEGTLFAPRAHVVDDSGKNIEGDVVAASLHQSGGEIHDFHFAHDVDVPPTTPSTSASTTTSAGPTTVTVTAPGGTTTVTAPGSTGTVTSTETVTATVAGPTTTLTAPGPTQTVTAPGTTVTSTVAGPTRTVTAPGTTATVTAPGTTTTVTAPGATVTSTVAGPTTTVTAPGTTETVTAPGTTATVTAPATTETVTSTVAGPTTTVTAPGTTDTITAPGTTETVTSTVDGPTTTVTAPGTTETVTSTTEAPARTVTVSGGVGPASSSRAGSTGSSSTGSSSTSAAATTSAAAATSSGSAVAAQSASRGSSAPAQPGLANTGVEIRATVAAGLALLVGGIGLVLLAARSGRREH